LQWDDLARGVDRVGLRSRVRVFQGRLRLLQLRFRCRHLRPIEIFPRMEAEEYREATSDNPWRHEGRKIVPYLLDNSAPAPAVFAALLPLPVL